MRCKTFRPSGNARNPQGRFSLFRGIWHRSPGRSSNSRMFGRGLFRCSPRPPRTPPCPSHRSRICFATLRGDCAPRGKRTSRVAIVVRARTSGHQWVLRLVGAVTGPPVARNRGFEPALGPSGRNLAFAPRITEFPTYFPGLSDFAAFSITPGMHRRSNRSACSLFMSFSTLSL